MRTPAMIVLAAVAAFALAWLLLVQVSEHGREPRRKVTAVQSAAPPARVAPGTASAAPAGKPPTEPSAASAALPPAEPPRDPAPADALEVRHEPVAPPVEPEPEDADDLREDQPADVDETAASEDEDAPPAPIDADHAADLVADWLAREEVAAETKGSTDQPENPALRDWTQFSGEEADPDWSEPTEQQVEAALERWIATLPESVRAHVAIVHIECRTSLCQILAADNDVATQNDRAQNGQEWQQALATLPAQTWWTELGFAGMQTTVIASEDGTTTLYQTYLRREAPPPAG